MAKVIRYTKYGYEIYDTQTMSYKPLDLSYIHVSEFNKGFAKTTKKADDGGLRYGYINTNGEEVVPTIFNDVSDVYNGYAFARDIWGVDIIRLKDGKHLNCRLSEYNSLYENRNYIRFVGEGIISEQRDYQFVYHYKINEKGELKLFLKDPNREIIFLSNYSNGCALAREIIWVDSNYLDWCGLKKKEKKYSTVVIDGNGNVLHRDIFEQIIYEFRDNSWYGLSAEFVNLSHIVGTIYKISAVHRMACLNDGLEIDELYVDFNKKCEEYYNEYYYCDPIEYCGLRRVVRICDDRYCSKSRRKWGYVDKNNVEVIECIYEYASIFVNNVARVRLNEDGNLKYHFINTKGEIIDHLQHLYNLNYIQGLATFNIGNITATIDKGFRNYCRYQNTELYIPGYLAIDSFVSGVAVAVDFNKKLGIIDIGGNKLSEFVYDNLYNDGEFIKTHKGVKQELFCSSQVWTLSLRTWSSSLGDKQGENKYGYMSCKGELLVDCEYDFLSTIEMGVARGCKNNQMCLININDKTIKYYTLENWIVDISGIAEVHMMQEDAFTYLSHEQKTKIVNGVKSKKWRTYYNALNNVVDEYLVNLDITNILKNYQIKLENYITYRRGDKDDDCETYFMSHYEDNGDVYLNRLLFYHKIIWSDRGFSARVQHSWWEKTKQYEEACISVSVLTEEKKKNFAEHYSKKEHRKTLVKHIHNELKTKAITEEVYAWIAPYIKLAK